MKKSLKNVSGSKRQQAAALRTVHSDRKQLDAYIRANGTMSVARRTAVVGGALEKLGYSHEQARDISLDAPLNSSMYDDQAIGVALVYASSITPNNIGSNADTIAGATAPTAIPMPSKAQAALDAYRKQTNPIQERRRLLGRRTNRLVDSISRSLKPLSDKIGDAPVPTGLGGLFLINLLFLFFAVPAHSTGRTRAQLLWLTLMNMTTLQEAPPVKTVPASPMFTAVTGAALAIEDVAQSVNNATGAVGQAGNLLQTIGSDIGHVIGIGGGPSGSQGQGGGPSGGGVNLRSPSSPPPPPSLGGHSPPPPPRQIVRYRDHGDTSR